MIAQIQIPEDLNGIFESLKEFFASRNAQYNTKIEENSITIEFAEPMKLEEEE